MKTGEPRDISLIYKKDEPALVEDIVMFYDDNV